LAQHVLIVEDEIIVLELLSTFLERAGYRVTGATTAVEALAAFQKAQPDIVLLDLVLPDEDGLVIVRKLRVVSKVPIIVLSARADNASRTTALELGANDYVTKGVDPQELLMRIGNLIGQGSSPANARQPEARGRKTRKEARFSGWTLSSDTHALTGPDGDEVSLSASEFQLLSALAKNPGHIVKRSTLVEALSGIDNGPTERNLDTYINRLRKKLETNPKSPRIIQTVRGVGYKLSP